MIDHPEAARVAEGLREHASSQYGILPSGRERIRDAAALIDSQSARIAELEKELRHLLNLCLIADAGNGSAVDWAGSANGIRLALTPAQEDPK